MDNKQSYKKGDKVWIQSPEGESSSSKSQALIIGVLSNTISFDRERHMAIRYLNEAGTNAYQCVPESWIVGYVDSE